jgi:predicted kinase
MSSDPRYSKVTRRVWNDARFKRLTPPPPNGQTLWFRLMTGPELNCIPGLLSIGEAGMAEALDWPLEGFRDAFAEVAGQGMAKADWKARLVWLPKAPAHNKPASANVILGWQSAWEELPECDLKVEAHRSLRAFAKAWGDGFLKAFDKACPKPSPNQEQEQEQDQEQEQENNPEGGAGSDDDEPSQPRKPSTSNSTAGLFPLEPSEPETAKATEAAVVAAVYAYWVETWKRVVGGGRPPVLDDKRRTAVRARLRQGFTLADLKNAIDGCFVTPFNLGENDRQRRYVDLELICRDAKHVEDFAATWEAQADAADDEELDDVTDIVPPAANGAALA